LLRGDRVATNGDCGVLIGGLPAALVAATADVPVYVLAPRCAYDPDAADGAALRTGAMPTLDVVPAHLITSLMNEAAR
jgi:methylthioribose-1-phosphate isomerase